MSREEATATWVGGLQFQGTATSGHQLIMDALPQFGGKDAGFRPLELFLVGLAGCTGMDVIGILQKMRQEVTGFEVKVVAQRREEHPRVYTDIALEYVFRGRGLEPRSLERAMELSLTKYCSAHAMLSRAAKVTSSYRIEEAPPLPG